MFEMAGGKFMKLNTLGIAHRFLEEKVPQGGLCIDATMGRGKDTAFLCELVGETGKVIAFDIQQEAVDSTDALLRQKGLRERAELRLESHVYMDKVAEPESVDAVVFNFGYLPGGDHTIFTHPDTSIQAIQKALVLIKKHGVVCACIYHGGDTGYEERDRLLEYLATIDPKEYTVLVTDFRNRPGDPPIAVFILRDI